MTDTNDDFLVCGKMSRFRYKCTLPEGHIPADMHEAVGSDDQVLDRWSDGE